MDRIEIRPSEGGDDAVSFMGEIADAVAAGLRRSGIEHLVSATPRGTTVHAAATPD